MLYILDKHLTKDQAHRAVELCRDIADGGADLKQLNQHTLIIWSKRHREFLVHWTLAADLINRLSNPDSLKLKLIKNGTQTSSKARGPWILAIGA